MQDLDVLGAGRAAPGVLAVVARPVHLRRACACEGSGLQPGLQLTVLCRLGAEMRAAAGLNCAGLRRHVAVRHESDLFVPGRTCAAKKLERHACPGQDYLAVCKILGIRRTFPPAWNFPKRRLTAFAGPCGEF